MGYPVVLIHGMWCQGAHWDRIKAQMTLRGYECHAPTLPGHDPGADQPQRVAALGLNDHLRFLEAYLQQQHFSRPPILIGHSMGGWLAQALAARTEVLALALLTPAAPAGINGLRASNLTLFGPHFARWGFIRKSYKPSLSLARRYLFNGLPASEQERIYASMVHESGRTPFELGMWWADGNKAARIDAAKVKCPVYVVISDTDGTTPGSVVRRVAALYPNATQRIYPQRGHWVVDDEDTDDMVHEICGWLRPIEQKRGRGTGPAVAGSRG